MAGKAKDASGINRVMKSVAAKNARSRLLSSSARHQAQQRSDYVRENGLDREDAGKSRSELNRTVGETETKNLKWASEHGGVRDYVAERAAEKTKKRNQAKGDAEYRMQYAEYLQTKDRDKDWNKGAAAIERKGQQQKRAKKW